MRTLWNTLLLAALLAGPAAAQSSADAGGDTPGVYAFRVCVLYVAGEIDWHAVPMAGLRHDFEESMSGELVRPGGYRLNWSEGYSSDGSGPRVRCSVDFPASEVAATRAAINELVAEVPGGWTRQDRAEGPVWINRESDGDFSMTLRTGAQPGVSILLE